MVKSSPGQPTDITIVELSCPYDTFIKENYQSKFDKYSPLCLAFITSGYTCTIIVITVGSLGHVHHRVVPGLKKLGFRKRTATAISKYCSTSCVIGSFLIWQNRWPKYDSSKT